MRSVLLAGLAVLGLGFAVAPAQAQPQFPYGRYDEYRGPHDRRAAYERAERHREWRQMRRERMERRMHYQSQRAYEEGLRDGARRAR